MSMVLTPFFFWMRVAENNFVHGGQGIGQVENAFEMLANVVCVEDRVFRGLTHAGAVRENVGERADQDAEISAEGFDSADGVRADLFEREASAFFFDENRHRAEGLENFLHRHRAGAGTAAAVGRRESFVQVEVHHVDAEIAGARDAGQRVHVGAVHIEKRALVVQNFCDFRDALFEDAERRGIGDHQRGDVCGDEVAQFIDVDLAVRFGLDVFDFVAGDDRGGGIRSVRRVGNQNFLARVAVFLVIGADQEEACQFAVRASSGLQRDRVHAGDFEEALFEELQNFQAALRKLLRLIGMLGGDAVEASDEFVDARVVFHGAGAQRIHAEVDGVVPGRETREVANDFDLADFGEAFDAFARGDLRRRTLRDRRRERRAAGVRTRACRARISRRSGLRSGLCASSLF